ncbi:MAG: DNA recombination protein RmuC [Kiritimatiellaeota bacterium]|nr:DNA recombination protein RmuC [Kiritimatiellota bacterium]
MTTIILLSVLLGLVFVAVVLLCLLLRRPVAQIDRDVILTALGDALNRTEQNIRSEVNTRLDALRGALDERLEQTRKAVNERLEQMRATTEDIMAKTRTEMADSAARSREEGRAQASEFQKATSAALADARHAQNQQLADFATRLGQVQTTLSETLSQTRAELNAAAAETRKTLDARLDALAAQNAEKLEQMRQTVDEKLQSTLEKRLGESFKLVGDNLERVIKSLGEMQAVASDVGDLKRVLANVKTRGTWGETQLAALLENFLQADQYAQNVRPNPRSDKVVEFAVKLPGRDDDGKPVWLPIDSKFPREDYERLMQAADRADAEGAEAASRALAAAVESFARDIRDKYIAPPHTTDFAVLFLPTEGLYAEVLRRPGLADRIQRDSRVLIAGPTTLAALLNSLQMGFRTLAIQKRSAEVWKTLGAIKTQLGLFGGLLDKVQAKLDEAGTAVGKASERHRILSGKLSKVEALPASEASALTGLDTAEDAAISDGDAP